MSTSSAPTPAGARAALSAQRHEAGAGREAAALLPVRELADKSAGKDRAALFDAAVRSRLADRLHLLNDLRRAVQTSEIGLVYQPVLGAADGRVRSVEALARWEHPVRGYVNPSDFIPLAERSDLIRALGADVLRRACTQLAAWRRDLGVLAPQTVSVNLSAVQLRSPGLVDLVRAALADAGLEGPDLCLELTESVLMHDPEAVSRQLESLRALGVRVAMDDFGTGYSSLAYLQQLPVDRLKLDRSLLGGLGQPGERSVVPAAVVLARGLALETVAEALPPGDDAAVAPTAESDVEARERAATTRLLLEGLERLPVQQSAALYVVQVADDPRSSAWDVGLGIGADPVLTARVLRLANSAYYGLSGRVSSPDFAVTLLGRDAVRAIAAAAAAGVVGDATLPPGFWSYSGVTAAAAALVAPKVGANRSEAFCLGLLHDLGAALLHQIDPARRTAIVDAAASSGVHPVYAEVPAFGLGHAEAAQRVLTAWRFPVELADAVAGHHRHPRDAMTALERTLQAAKALVRDLPTVPRHEVPEDVEAALRAGRVTSREEAALRQQALEQAGQLAATLGEGGTA